MGYDDVPTEELRRHRDEQLVKGLFASAQNTQQKIEERIGGPDETAALSEDRDRRLHEPLDDPEELKERRDDAEEWGFQKLAREYSARLDEITPDPEPDEAALEQQTRAALAEPSEEVRERAEAALGADDAVESTDRGMEPAEYLFARYGLDAREYSDGYALREAVRDAEPQRMDDTDDGVSTAHAALSIRDRADLDHSTSSAVELIQERYGIDATRFDSAEALRDAIDAQGGDETGDTNMAETRFSALSANRRND